MNSSLTWNAVMATNFDSRDLDPAEEQVLVARATSGDEEAFSVLVRRHQVRVFKLASRFFRQRADVEDAAQDTFLTAWSKLATYRAEAPFEHWLTRICLNTCYGKLRKKRPTDEASRVDVEADLKQRPVDPDARLEVEGLLRGLKPQDRFILLLMHGEGWSTQEIAARLGWTRVNVKVRAHRARKQLRRLLEEGR